MPAISKYPFRFRQREGKQYIFDAFRKKYVVLTPEEWVRQNILAYLTTDLNYPKSLISVEYFFRKNDVQHRCDALIFDKTRNPWMLLEFKSADIKITQEVLDQALVYQQHTATPFFVLSNGSETLCFRHYKDGITLLKNLPVFGEL